VNNLGAWQYLGRAVSAFTFLVDLAQLLGQTYYTAIVVYQYQELFVSADQL